jgi:recombination protein RecR
MSFSPLIEQLITALRCLPGVGPKSAQRMAMQLLERDRDGGRQLSAVLAAAMDGVGRCRQCRTFTEQDTCQLCLSEKRNKQLLCVVETPADVLAIEQAGGFDGCYFVLMGHLSPIDGIGPDDIGIDKLLALVQQQQVGEVIMATNPTVEGEATAYYIAEQLQSRGVTVSRIAHGVPLGGELEYIDGGTLAHALAGRKVIAS